MGICPKQYGTEKLYIWCYMPIALILYDSVCALLYRAWINFVITHVVYIYIIVWGICPLLKRNGDKCQDTSYYIVVKHFV